MESQLGLLQFFSHLYGGPNRNMFCFNKYGVSYGNTTFCRASVISVLPILIGTLKTLVRKSIRNISASYLSIVFWNVLALIASLYYALNNLFSCFLWSCFGSLKVPFGKDICFIYCLIVHLKSPYCWSTSVGEV